MVVVSFVAKVQLDLSEICDGRCADIEINSEHREFHLLAAGRITGVTMAFVAPIREIANFRWAKVSEKAYN